MTCVWVSVKKSGWPQEQQMHLQLERWGQSQFNASHLSLLNIILLNLPKKGTHGGSIALRVSKYFLQLDRSNSFDSSKLFRRGAFSCCKTHISMHKTMMHQLMWALQPTCKEKTIVCLESITLANTLAIAVQESH